MENRSHALMTGFFTIALVVAAVLAALWFNRDRSERVPYMIATTQVLSGLNPQAAVRYRGLEVGKVADIDFDAKIRGQVDISLAIDPDTPVTTTTFATLGYQGVTGIAYIQLDDERVGSPALPTSKQHVAVIPLRPGFLDQLEKKGKVILDQAEEMTQRVNALFSPANQKTLMNAVDAYGRIPQQLDPTLQRLPELAARTDQTMKAFNDTAAKVGRLSQDWDSVAAKLNAPDGPIEHLNRTVDRVNGVAANVELQALPHVVDMTDEARSSLRAVKRTMNGISERPQSLIFGPPAATPGPGEPGFTPPTK